MLFNKLRLKKPSSDRVGTKAIRGFLTSLVVLVHAVVLAAEAETDPATPINIVNGKSMSYTSIADDNWYKFSLNERSNVLFLGDDSNGSYVGQIKIYNNNLEHINYVYTPESINLDAGTYLINILDKISGTFTAYSTNMSNPVDNNPVHGSVLDPYLPENGIAIAFNTRVQTNVFSFGMQTSGNIRINGTDARGYDVGSINIYNNELELIDSVYTPESIKLDSGKYYLVINDNYPGSINLYSSVFKPLPLVTFNPRSIVSTLHLLLGD